MLKEVATLFFILWCTQAAPTTTLLIIRKLTLDQIYCDAESLFGDYRNGKHFPPEMRPTFENQFPELSCNFTKAPGKEEMCKTIQTYHELFTWLKERKRDDSLLKPLMANHSFSSIVQDQGYYLKYHCPHVAPTGVTQSKDFNHEPSRENQFYYIFEQYKYCTLKFWRQQVTQKVNESDLCKSKQ